MKVKKLFESTIDELEIKLQKMKDNLKRGWLKGGLSYKEKNNLENLSKRISKLSIEIEIKRREKN
jgi:hypothetical protein